MLYINPPCTILDYITGHNEQPKQFIVSEINKNQTSMLFKKNGAMQYQLVRQGHVTL